MRCLCCLRSTKTFLLCFGVLYTVSVFELLRRTAVIDSDLEVSIGNTRIQLDNLNRSKSATTVHNQVKDSLHQKQPSHDDKVQKTAAAVEKSPSLNSSGLDCQKLKAPVFLEPGKMPLTALHSFPGSGNTWVRVLLSSLTGFNTGDIYKDGAFAKTPGFSFRKDDTVIAVKTHHPFWDDFNGPDPSAPKNRYWQRSIIIVRHPLDATISVFNFFRMRGSHTKSAPLEKYLKKDGKPTNDWNKWAHDQIRNWGRCLDYWVNIFKGPKVIIFYEDLRKNLLEQLLIINDFLGLKLDPRRLNCTVQSNAQQKFHRNQKIDKRLLYDTSMLNEVEVVLEHVRELLTQNYTHLVPGFRIPDNYAVNLVRENFSVKPNISQHPPQS